MRPVAHRCTLIAAMKAEQLSKSYTTATTCKHNSAQIPCISDFHSVVKSAEKFPSRCSLVPFFRFARLTASWNQDGRMRSKRPHKWPGIDFWTTLPTFYAVSSNASQKLSNLSKLSRLAFPIVLIALLMATTLGVVWHQHATSSPDTCPICHLSHQAIEPAPARIRVCALIPTGSTPEPHHHRSTPGPIARYIPARAPPA